MTVTTEFSKAADLALETHPHDLPHVRFTWADKYKSMKVGETKTLINGVGEQKEITRTRLGWTLTR